MDRQVSEFPEVTIDGNVLHFASAQGILPHVRAAISLAVEQFKTVAKVETRLQQDPDTGARRVIIDLTVDGDIDQVLAAKDAFDRAWTERAPAEVQDTIRLLYDFAE